MATNYQPGQILIHSHPSRHQVITVERVLESGDAVGTMLWTTLGKFTPIRLEASRVSEYIEIL